MRFESFAELWSARVFKLLGATAIVFAGACSSDDREEPEPSSASDGAQPTEVNSTTGGQAAPDRQGLWQRGRKLPQSPATEAEEIAALDSIGYGDGYNPATELGGVTLHDRSRAEQGFNFYTSGHGPEIILTDMDGEVLHRWKKPIAELWPDREISPDHIFAQYFRRAILLPEGEVLAVVAGYGLVKLDKHSNLIWSYDSRVHHDLELLPDGRILTLTRETNQRPDVNLELPIVEDFVVILDAEGRELSKVSVLDALQNASEEYPQLVEQMPTDGDLLHTNSVEMLDGRMAANQPAFAAGNVLTSLHRTSVVAVIDLAQEKIVWAKQGRWKNQHHPRVLDDRRILIFNNQAGKNASGSKVSSVLEFDVVEQKVSWSFRGNRSVPFRSEALGSVHRLPNGNTLIIESQFGRGFELTPKKQVVWEFYSPHRAGDDDELVAVLLDIVRIPLDFPLDWLGK